LAEAAGRRAGMKNPTSGQVAEHPQASLLRDSLWEDLEARLRDTQTYTLEEIRKWLTQQGAELSMSAVDRARVFLLERERAMVLAAGRARAFVDAAQKQGASSGDVLKAGRLQAAQLIFQSLAELPANVLEGLEPPKLLQLLDCLARLSTSDAASDLMRRKLADQFDKAARKVEALADGEGKIPAEKLTEIREAVFGSAG
jgi:hypothetical protein